MAAAPFANPNAGTIAFSLVDITGQAIADPQVRFQFRRVSDLRGVGDAQVKPLNGQALNFSLPAFPLQELYCDITPSLYRYRPSPVFRVRPQSVVPIEVEVARDPLRWKAEFTRWTALGSPFDNLKKVLRDSDEVFLMGTNEVMKGNARSYDRVPSHQWELAKATLLNLYSRLSNLVDPISAARPWFSYVRKIRYVGQERFLAEVDPVMENLVRTISRDITEYSQQYERTPAENHRGFLPDEYRMEAEMVSIKTTDEFGNLQLTISHLPSKNLTLLDSDIDENGNLLRHFFDLVKHKFTGGTHPYDIHEILYAQNPSLDLGYTLVPA